MNSTGRMAEDEREHDLDRHLHRLLFRSLPALDAHLAGLHSQDIGDRDAVRSACMHRADEALEILAVGARSECRVGVASGTPDLMSCSVRISSSDERPRAVLGGLRHRSLEAESGLNGDRHLVERVGEREQDRLLRSSARLFMITSGMKNMSTAKTTPSRSSCEAAVAKHQDDADHDATAT